MLRRRRLSGSLTAKHARRIRRGRAAWLFGALVLLLVAGALIWITTQPTPISRAAGPGTWSTESSPNLGSGNNELQAVALDSTGSPWAVGSYITSLGARQSLVLNKTSNGWTSWGLPYLNGSQLLGVAAPAPNNVWAVGTATNVSPNDTPLVLHWDGSNWNQVTAQILTGSNENILHGVVVDPQNSANIWVYLYSV